MPRVPSPWYRKGRDGGYAIIAGRCQRHASTAEGKRAASRRLAEILAAANRFDGNEPTPDGGATTWTVPGSSPRLA